MNSKSESFKLSEPHGLDEIASSHDSVSHLIAGVREASRGAMIKSVHAADAFMGLHPDVQLNISGICDLAHDSFAFDEKLRSFAENAFSLTQMNEWLLMRCVKAKILSTEAPDEGWVIEGEVKNAIDAKVRNVIMVTVRKVLGDFTRYPRETVHRIPLHNVLPFNIKK